LTDTSNRILILGGGLTGLSAGYVLSEAGFAVTVFERDPVVGGISKTIKHHGFRFDLGGHRFFTTNARINEFVQKLMAGELILVPRRSKILLRGKYFDYPLKPMNALFGMGVATTFRILVDYGIERIKRLLRDPKAESLEDWVIAHFGRTMFDIYFKEYSEKVWGIACHAISAEWVAQRIRGLSLSKAVANAFFKLSGKDVPSLVDEFSYPRLGIGRIPERLREGIEKSGRVLTNTRVERISHSKGRIASVTVREDGTTRAEYGSEFVSSMPVTALVSMLDPAPPEDVLAAAAKLKFRDLVIVTLMIARERVTDQTWIYIPEKKIPFGRLHEPTNWSEDMAPKGKTLLVLEFFSFQGDEIWNAADEALVSLSVEHLERLGFIKRDELIDSSVVRAPKAYPLFEVGYEKHFNVVVDYLAGFENLHIAGRVGMFKYYNMDHAIESGMDAAERIMARQEAAANL
jgi:protoporphyrinogen oxidase